MRLTVAIETNEAKILKGPGSTAMLKAALQLLGIGGRAYAGCPGPKLEFTIENPVDSTKPPMKVMFEITNDFTSFNDQYSMTGLISGNPNTVRAVYHLSAGAKGYITDLL